MRPAEGPLSFDVIVPTRNRPERLAACLRALARLDYPPDRFQVTVVDDGSTESMRPVVERFADQISVGLLERPHAGPAVARNAGAEGATAPYLAFTDDDCAPARGWLRALAVAFDAAPADMLGGATVNVLSANLFSETSQELVDYLYEYYNPGGETARFLTSNNLAVPTDHFLALAGFSGSFPRAAAEDRDLCERWLRAGHRMRYVPDAVVHHAHELGARSFWRQHFNYGRGAYGYHHLRAQRGSGPVRLEPIRFYARMLRYPISRGGPLRSIAISGLLVLSQVANAGGYFWEDLRHRFARSLTREEGDS